MTNRHFFTQGSFFFLSAQADSSEMVKAGQVPPTLPSLGGLYYIIFTRLVFVLWYRQVLMPKLEVPMVVD